MSQAFIDCGERATASSRSSCGHNGYVGDHLLTLIAYAGIGAATGWWFWRAHTGFLTPGGHGVVSVIFGLMWPISLPWRALVRLVSRAIATHRARRVDPSVDDQLLDK